jgi:hypothetical protein
MPVGNSTVNRSRAALIALRLPVFVLLLITLIGPARRSDSLLPMRLTVPSSIIAFAIFAAACGGGTTTSTPATTAPVPEQHPLASLAATGAVVAPTYALHVASELGWANQPGSTRELLRALDDDIAAAIAGRGLKTGWLMPADLALSYKRNPTYATDPYALAEEPLKSPAFIAGTRIGEPLASELRTMIALHENARAVLLPVELRFDRADAASTAARATLKLALIDPRFAEAKWVGTVKGDTTSADPRTLTRVLARAVADLVTAR